LEGERGCGCKITASLFYTTSSVFQALENYYLFKASALFIKCEDLGLQKAALVTLPEK